MRAERLRHRNANGSCARRLDARRRLLFALPFLFLLAHFFSLPAPFVALRASAYAAGAGSSLNAPSANATIVLVLVDGIQLDDVIDRGPGGEARVSSALPGFSRLARAGSVGLMNVRTAGAYDPESARLTLGAASRASAPAGSILLRPVGEPLAGEGAGEPAGGTAGEVYSRRTGLEAPEDGFVVLDLSALRRRNAEFRYTIRLGALGETLQQAGRRVTLLAPALPPTGEGTAGEGVPGAAVAMDADGVVRRAVVGDGLLAPDAAAPVGRRTDAQAVARQLERFWGETDLFVIDLPDGRFHMWERRRMTVAAADAAKRRAVQSVDSVLRALLARVDLGRDWLALAVPTPDPAGRAAGNLLTPLFLAGPVVAEGGWLTSPTTRRPGIVAMTDLAPTVLADQTADGAGAMSGRPIDSEPRAGDAVADLADLNERLVATYAQRPTILKSFVTFEIVVWLFGLAILLAGERLPAAWRRRAARGLQWMLLVTMSLPVSLLFASPAAFPGAWATGAAALLGALLLAAATRFAASRSGLDPAVRLLIPVYVIALVTALALTVDVVRGAPWMQASVLGYDPAVGARYYGIGNEYMGILIGATLVGATSLEDRVRPGRRGRPAVARLATLALFGATLATVALPWWGANVGGALVAAVGTAFTTFLLYKRRVTWLDFVWAILLAAATLAALTAIDLLGPGTPSHLGRLATAVAEEGAGPFLDVVWRKVEINLRLFQYSIWSRAFAIALAVLVLRFVRPSPLFKRIRGRFPSLFKGIWGATLAGMVAFVVNDSGVIAAATTTLYASGALLYVSGIGPPDG